MSVIGRALPVGKRARGRDRRGRLRRVVAAPVDAGNAALVSAALEVAAREAAARGVPPQEPEVEAVWGRTGPDWGVLIAAAAAAQDWPVPDEAAALARMDRRVGPLVRLLMGLHRAAGGKPFAAGGGVLARQADVSTYVAWQLLQALQTVGVVQVVRKGTAGIKVCDGGHVTAWRYVARNAADVLIWPEGERPG